MELIPATSFAARAQRTTHARTARHLRWRARAADVVVIGLGVVVGFAWLGMLDEDRNPLLLVVPALIGVASVGVLWNRSVPQALVRTAFWASFVCGTLVTVVKSSERAIVGASIAVPAAVALVLLSRVSRRARGHHPAHFLVVVLACADIAVHGLICAFVHEIEVWRLFGGIAVANAIGLFFFAGRGQRAPHVIANVVVIGLVFAFGPDFPHWFYGVLIGCALLQIGAVAATTLPAPLPKTSRTVGRVVVAAVAVIAALDIWVALS